MAIPPFDDPWYKTCMSTKRRSSGYAPRRSSPGARLWVPVAAVLVIALLVLLKVTAPPTVNALDNKPVAAGVVQNLTTVSPKTFAVAATTAPASPAVAGSSTTWTSGGKPVVFYYGFEWCPYCAASRWAIVTALARFGTWSGLEYMTSSPTDVDPNTHTVTFLHATYTSPYITFESVEAQNPLHATLQTPTGTQQTALSKYDPGSGGAFSGPFIDVSNRYLWEAALVLPTYLHGMGWTAISAAVHSGKGPAGTHILAGANALSAAICAVDGDQPAAVCTSATVAKLMQGLPKPGSAA